MKKEKKDVRFNILLTKTEAENLTKKATELNITRAQLIRATTLNLFTNEKTNNTN
jgi:hypothetical protein